MMNVKQMYSMNTGRNATKSPYKTLKGVVEDVEMHLQGKRATLFFVIGGKQFWIMNSESGVPVLYVGDVVLLHFNGSEFNQKPDGIQVLTDLTENAYAKLRIISSYNAEFR